MTQVRSKQKRKAFAFEQRRAALTRRIAQALLAAGVADIPLRELAAQLGTSDRMLLYYFADKADVVQSSLSEMSAGLAQQLDTRLPQRSRPDTLLTEVGRVLATKETSRLMTVWADLSARGSRGEEPFATIARSSIHWWLERLEMRLDMPQGARRRETAIAILTVIEGVRLLEAFVPNLTSGTLPMLSNAIFGQRAKKRTPTMTSQ